MAAETDLAATSMDSGPDALASGLRIAQRLRRLMRRMKVMRGTKMNSLSNMNVVIRSLVRQGASEALTSESALGEPGECLCTVRDRGRLEQPELVEECVQDFERGLWWFNWGCGAAAGAGSRQ